MNVIQNLQNARTGILFMLNNYTKRNEKLQLQV